MTKNRSMRIAVLVLALALITCCFVGTTFAKYTSRATGSGSLTVAKWSFTLDGNELASADNSKTFELNLANSILENGGDDATTEDDVINNKIAPGTKGAGSFTVENESEVTAFLKVELQYDDSALDFLTIGATYDKDGVATAIPAEGIELTPGASAEITVDWAWAFTGGANTDAEDTALGLDPQEYDIDVVLTMDQKN